METFTKTELTTRQNVIQFFKFTAFSISAGAIQVISFTLLNETTHMPYWPSYLIALVLSVLYNFTINRRYTFKSVANIPLAIMKLTCYYSVFTPLSALWGELLTDRGWNYYVVLIGTMIINFITEFLYSRFLIFSKSINTNKLGILENERYERMGKGDNLYQ